MIDIRLSKCVIIAADDFLPALKGRGAQWLVTCTRKPIVPGLSPAASYVQR